MTRAASRSGVPITALDDPVEQDFADGYRDGRDPDCPEPSANRSHAYRHSFAIGRAERARKPIPAATSRAAATAAEGRDRAR